MFAIFFQVQKQFFYIVNMNVLSQPKLDLMNLRCHYLTFKHLKNINLTILQRVRNMPDS